MAKVVTGTVFKKIIDKLTGKTKDKVPCLIRTSSKIVFRESGEDVESSLVSIDLQLKKLNEIKFSISDGCLVVTYDDGK